MKKLEKNGLMEAEIGCDLEDILLGDMAVSVKKLQCVFGKEKLKIRIGDHEGEIEPFGEDPGVGFYARLEAIMGGARVLVDHGASYADSMAKLLVYDGWSWNENVFRGPIWMNDRREIPIDHARKIKGLEWLEGTSLEIK